MKINNKHHGSQPHFHAKIGKNNKNEQKLTSIATHHITHHLHASHSEIKSFKQEHHVTYPAKIHTESSSKKATPNKQGKKKH